MIKRTRSMRRAVCGLALGAALAVAARGGSAQQASLQGVVTSSATASTLEGVAVTLTAGGQRVKVVFTDRDGFYQMGGIRPGSYVLSGEQLGYRPHEQTVTLAAGGRARVNLRLEADPVQLEGIVVSPEKGAAVRDLGRQVVTPLDIHRVPIPAGTGDLASYLQTLPAVTTTSDRGGQVFVRGGTPAENLVLVDGIPIYRPFHIVGFFSVFPEDLVSSADFHASGFGARYAGRTSSVLDVRMRDGNFHRRGGVVSVSPFLAEGVAEGPLPGKNGLSFVASVRHSLIEQTTGTLIGEKQPYSFDSQLLKLTTTGDERMRCSALMLRTYDRGRLDPEEKVSHVSWHNFLLGGRCVNQYQGVVRFGEVAFSYTGFDNEAISRGASLFRSKASTVNNEAHLTGLIGAVPVFAGYHLAGEFTNYDLMELFGIGRQEDASFDLNGYLEASLPLRKRGELRPGVVLVLMPQPTVEPRVRASWKPFGRPTETIDAAFGLYHQNLVGVSDIRDVTSAFTAWLDAPGDKPLTATHYSVGWQQSLPNGFRYSAEGYYKRMRNIPIPQWRGTAAFATTLTHADGTSYGADTRLEYTGARAYGFLGYGYSWTEYQASQEAFADWFGQAVQSYHPPHDRRHQVNALATIKLGRVEASARWQFGSGLPFTQPLGFDEAFDYRIDLYDTSKSYGLARVLLDRPYNGRLPMVHRLDLSLQRSFELSAGKLQVQAGAINTYDRRNIFYYDLYTARRVNQLPLLPYMSVTLRGR